MSSVTIISNLLTCDKLFEQKPHYILIAVFLISYVFFNFLFKSEKTEEEQTERRERINQAQEYLTAHEKEDFNFFVGEYAE